jgi:hypothetical protein
LPVATEVLRQISALYAVEDKIHGCLTEGRAVLCVPAVADPLSTSFAGSSRLVTDRAFTSLDSAGPGAGSDEHSIHGEA